MDTSSILAITDFSRARLLGTLDAIEKSGQNMTKVLSWRPAANRSHIAWQAMHCAATHDRYLQSLILGGKPTDEPLVAAYAGGSTPSDTNIPTLATIREKLAKQLTTYRGYIAAATPEELARVLTMPNGTQRTVGESFVLLAWHEAHHQGQIHLTWNLYQGAHGLK